MLCLAITSSNRLVSQGMLICSSVFLVRHYICWVSESMIQSNALCQPTCSGQPMKCPTVGQGFEHLRLQSNWNERTIDPKKKIILKCIMSFFNHLCSDELYQLHCVTVAARWEAGGACGSGATAAGAADWGWLPETAVDCALPPTIAFRSFTRFT